MHESDDEDLYYEEDYSMDTDLISQRVADLICLSDAFQRGGSEFRPFLKDAARILLDDMKATAIANRTVEITPALQLVKGGDDE